MVTTWKGLGARHENDLVSFTVFSRNATRVEVYLYDAPADADEKCSFTLGKATGDSTWSVSIPLRDIRDAGIASTIYYGLRAWGPNWPYDSTWQKGSAAGYITDVDGQGNRFNPNKLLIDPYAREIDNDPKPRLSSIDPNEYIDDFYSGEAPGSSPPCRNRDTGKIAPKGIVLTEGDATDIGRKPARHIKDDIIYEVHVRDLTMADNGIDQNLRGTFKGAGRKARYFSDLGITAVEFLPVFAFANKQNDDKQHMGLGTNHWGYMSLNFFAPNRRYSSDKSPGGPTREFKEMVRAFHDEGIKVFLDVAYNHTGEGLLKRHSDSADRNADSTQYPERACLLSFRGLDNATYYQCRSDGDKGLIRYLDNSSCGANLKTTEEVVRNLVLDSLKYWSHEMGVDGFRFDLAPILGNGNSDGRFVFQSGDPENILNRAVAELPARASDTSSEPQGVDLIAEPWVSFTLPGDQGKQLGNFPQAWSEWNDQFRDCFRKAENKLGVQGVAPSYLSNSLAGSDQLFKYSGVKKAPAPWHSVNYIASHDEYNLRDLFSYSKGEDICWDHGGDASLQRQAVRNALAVMMVSAGVPMLFGGDELFRTRRGDRQTVGIDDDWIYLQWDKLNGDSDEMRTYLFARNAIKFRKAHPALSPASYYTGSFPPGDGSIYATWYRPDGETISGDYWGNDGNNFVGFLVDGSRVGDDVIYICYNKGGNDLDVVLPHYLSGKSWYRICDTAAWMEQSGNWEDEGSRIDKHYFQHGRSLLIFIGK